MEHNDKVHNGFQAARSFVKRPEAAGSLQQLILNYVRVDSEYFEVWWDVQFPSFIDQFMSELKVAQGLGYEKYKESLEKAGVLWSRSCPNQESADKQRHI